MADKLKLEVVTPDHSVLDQEVDEVVLPSVEGYFGVLPGHAPLLAQLDVGEVSYRVGKERRFLAISGGYAEVLRTGVSVLARTAERADEIDVDRARRAKDRAESQLKQNLALDDLRRAEVKLKRAISRLSVHDRS
ncbi:MAG TPA: F0F1 ATP synthase subunit epsilon [Candidatus Polarisedimenticolaceae bacterium]|nr:F0F1 ATP synthase subunit epsilon [Candidatus Polarisedimenticolaceae bacterium]